MTDVNKYNPYPDTCSIRCPNCQKEATFSVPFVFLTGSASNRAEAIQTLASPRHSLETWGGWTVLVQFPELFPWKAPGSSGYSRDDRGVCSCSYCGRREKHHLQWPQDAYFTCEIKGHTLWAWTRDHAQALKSYIESTDRKKLSPLLLIFYATSRRSLFSRRTGIWYPSSFIGCYRVKGVQ